MRPMAMTRLHRWLATMLRVNGRKLASEARQAQWVLRRSQEQLQLLVEGVTDYGIWMLDPAGRVLTWNAGAQRLTGYRGREIIGQSLARFYPAEEVDRGSPDHALSMAAGLARFEDESWRVRKDGSRFRANQILTALREHGRLRGYAVVVRDVTAKREAEQTLRRYSERMRLLSARLVEVQEGERRHLARELHDDVGQALTALKLDLQALERAQGETARRAALAECLRIVDHTLQHVRNLSLSLRPAMLDDLGLVAALRWYLDTQGRRAGFRGQVSAALGNLPVPQDVETACFRIVQEAVTNAVRHARATAIWVTLTRTPEALELTIRDNGLGFDVAAARERAARGSSLGLLNMEERAMLCGGELSITSSPRSGTRIHARFPIAAPVPVGGPA